MRRFLGVALIVAVLVAGLDAPDLALAGLEVSSSDGGAPVAGDLGVLPSTVRGVPPPVSIEERAPEPHRRVADTAAGLVVSIRPPPAP